MGITEIALIIGFILSFLMAIAMGGNDASTPCSDVVGAGVLTIKQAVILFAIFTAIGAMSQGFMVMKTVGTGIVPYIDLLGAIIIVVSAFIWVMFCNVYGLEISVTHSIVGGVFGYGMAVHGVGGIQWSLLQTIVVSWFASPLLAMVFAFLLYRLLVVFVTKYEGLNKIMSFVLKLALCYSAYAFGANDIGNATAVFVTVTKMALGHAPEYNVMILLAIFGSVGIAIGGIWLGPNVINTVAFKILKLNVVGGFAAEFTNAAVVNLFTSVPYMLIGYGIPVSTSLANIGALVGVGFASYGSSGFNRRTVAILAMGWIATVLVTAVLSYVGYLVLFPFIGPILKPTP